MVSHDRGCMHTCVHHTCVYPVKAPLKRFIIFIMYIQLFYHYWKE